MAPESGITQQTLYSLVEVIMNDVYECIEKHPGITTSEALCRYLLAGDIHCELQIMIQTGQIVTKQDLIFLAGEYVTERLVTKSEFTDVIERPFCVS